MFSEDLLDASSDSPELFGPRAATRKLVMIYRNIDRLRTAKTD